jgi:hypothetical protein
MTRNKLGVGEFADMDDGRFVEIFHGSTDKVGGARRQVKAA